MIAAPKKRATRPTAAAAPGDRLANHEQTTEAVGVLAELYDAWNRLVKVTASNDTDVTIQTAEYDGKGRRMKKRVKKSGDLDKTVVYLY